MLLLVVGIGAVLMLVLAVLLASAHDDSTYDRVSAGNGENHDGYTQRRV